jgi:[acyl-carrier-protein] S-malonyltransferase
MPGFAMLFPGQGSQSVGMLGQLAEKYPAVNETFAEAGEVLGYDLLELVRNGPNEDLDRTERTQPALVAAGVAVWRVWEARGGPRPTLLAGHSLGEYTALVCGGALNFGDALRLTELRGQAMQAAVPAGTGGMAAIIGLGDQAVASVCEEAAEGEIVSPANFNAPGQVVIAGSKAAVDRAAALAKEQGARMVKPLAVSVPSHCALMRPAGQRLASHLSEIPLREPQIPVLHNLDARDRPDVDGIRKALVAQLDNPVQWVETVRAIRARGIDIMAECGPGKVLCGLIKRIDKEARALPLNDPDGLRAALSEFDK